MWMIYPLLFLAGFVDSIAGGGGLISLPSYLAIGLPAHLALGTNKFTSTPGTATAAFRFARKGYVNWKSAVAAFGGALTGSYIGSQVVLLLSDRNVRVIMVVLVPVVAVFLLTRKERGIRQRELSDMRTVVYSILVGLCIGAYDGFFGPGTGTFLILAFTGLIGFDTMTACGNTKVVNFASNLAAVTSFVLGGSVDYRLGIPCAACNILGNIVGSELAMRKGTLVVRPMMVVMIVVLMGKIVWDLVAVQL